MIKHLIYYLFIIFSTISCSHYPDDVENVLKFAGDNRVELEKVLKHYSNDETDSLKYKAACFLIRNMRYHHSQNNESLNTFRHYILDTLPTHMTYRNFQKKYGELSNHYNVIYDAHVITADYLIRNIDFSFILWKEMPWGKYYSFNIFCEELLPYRIGNEPIEDWKEVYFNRYKTILDTAHYDRSSSFAAWRVIFEYVNSSTHLLEWVFAYDWMTPNLGALTLLDLRYGTCQEQADMLTYVMRSLGIPGGIDMMVQRPDKMARQHWWNYMRDTNGWCTAFDFYYDMDEPAEKLACIHKCGVAYRKCFTLQEESFMKYHDKGIYIPESLNKLFLKNVSYHYFDENPVILQVDKKYKNGDILYLSVFNNIKWVPIMWDEVNDGVVSFRYLEPNVLYQLTHFSSEGTCHPESNPFILYQDGMVHFTKVNNSLHDMKLNRKFPFPLWWPDFREVALGGKFQLANQPDFSDAVTVYTIQNTAMRYMDIHINQPQLFRYVRYLSSPEGGNMMAELKIFSGDEQLQGEIIGTDGSYQDFPDKTKYSVFDGDILTYFSAKESGAWAGLKFNRPQRVTHIRYWLRNDDNSIREDDNYELFYWDENSWISAGRQTAVDTLLHYHQIPSGTLYWLRNHTRGKEERPFTYENGKQIFW